MGLTVVAALASLDSDELSVLGQYFWIMGMGPWHGFETR